MNLNYLETWSELAWCINQHFKYLISLLICICHSSNWHLNTSILEFICFLRSNTSTRLQPFWQQYIMPETPFIFLSCTYNLRILIGLGRKLGHNEENLVFPGLCFEEVPVVKRQVPLATISCLSENKTRFFSQATTCSVRSGENQKIVMIKLGVSASFKILKPLIAIVRSFVLPRQLFILTVKWCSRHHWQS